MAADEGTGDRPELNEETRRIWDRNAEWWDDRIGDGNAYQIELIEPAQERLTPIEPGMMILDVACGAGRFTRRMAERGAHVVAFDFSERFIERAKQRTPPTIRNIEYHVADATDTRQLLAFGRGRFDGSVATMALMDIADIEPLFGVLAELLKPGGWFVFSVMHPCFQSAEIRKFAEMTETDGETGFLNGVKVTRYLTPRVWRGEGIVGQPERHHYFHRPLSVLFDTGFRSGFVLDALEEPAFPGGQADVKSVRWRDMPEIPPVLVARMRLASPPGDEGQASGTPS